MKQMTMIVSLCLCIQGIAQAENVEQATYDKKAVIAKLQAMQKLYESRVIEFDEIFPEGVPHCCGSHSIVLIIPEDMRRETQSEPEVEVETEVEVPLSTVTASFDVTSRAVTQAEIQDSDGSLEATDQVHEFYLTADSDLIVIGVTSIETADGEIYQHPYGSDTDAPHPALVAEYPSLAADSFITTPGSTGILGGGFEDIDSVGEVAWYDLSQDGPIEDFLFAQLTTEGGIFEGDVYFYGLDGPESFPFSFTFGDYSSLTPIPEPSSLLLLLLGLPFVKRVSNALT